ncbi:hypothetical protein HMPREF2995_07790 [Propionibacterium sp. HMSC062D02]|nr:hypothetical protein HMPREF2995_07790 [Propionibacterium sp. HMSC062D02]
MGAKMDIIIMVLIAALVLTMILRGVRKSIFIVSVMVIAVLCVILLSLHATSDLGLSW